MNNHYYNKNPIVEHDERIINAVFLGKSLGLRQIQVFFQK